MTNRIYIKGNDFVGIQPVHGLLRTGRPAHTYSWQISRIQRTLAYIGDCFHVRGERHGPLTFPWKMSRSWMMRPSFLADIVVSNGSSLFANVWARSKLRHELQKYIISGTHAHRFETTPPLYDGRCCAKGESHLLLATDDSSWHLHRGSKSQRPYQDIPLSSSVTDCDG